MNFFLLLHSPHLSAAAASNKIDFIDFSKCLFLIFPAKTHTALVFTPSPPPSASTPPQPSTRPTAFGRAQLAEECKLIRNHWSGDSFMFYYWFSTFSAFASGMSMMPSVNHLPSINSTQQLVANCVNPRAELTHQPIWWHQTTTRSNRWRASPPSINNNKKTVSSASYQPSTIQSLAIEEAHLCFTNCSMF